MRQILFNNRLLLPPILTLSIILWISTAAANIDKPGLSPYIHYHADDLVQWQSWSETSLAKAKKENKLILISSGYLACHYCHVMKRESFENSDIAGFINQHFVPVIIDREMMPVLDSQLLKFMEVIEQPQGWPLQVILTPDANPLVGAVYQPPDTFLSFLNAIQQRWQKSPQQLNTIAEKTTQGIIRQLSIQTFTISDSIASELINALQQQVFLVSDLENGGFGDDSKYPMTPQLSALLKLYATTGDPQQRQILTTSLDAMAEGALHDAVNGGFFRYATAVDWGYPHYEKMLDTNVQLAGIYLEAAGLLQQPAYRLIAAKTLDMLIGDFALDGGGFASSLSASDRDGRDGGTYLWRESDLKTGFQADEFERMNEQWLKIHASDGISYLPIIGNLNSFTKASGEYRYWQSIYSRLRQIGNNNRPARDNKLVTAMQGLALSTFSRYASQDANPRYRRAAEQLFQLVTRDLWQADALLHSNLGGAGTLADYAYLADGLYEYFRMSSNREALTWSTRLVSIAWRKFYIDGFWRHQENLDLLLPYTVYPVILQDTQLPSASATLIRLSYTLAPQLDDRYVKLAEQAQRNADINMAQAPFFYASHILTLVNRQ